MAGKKNKSAAKREAARRAAQALRREERARRRAPDLPRNGKSSQFPPRVREDTPGRVFLFFAAVFALVLLLESERFAVFMDSLAPSPLAERCAKLARSLGGISGLAALTAHEDALVLALADKNRVGVEKAASVSSSASDVSAGSLPSVFAAAPQSLPSGPTSPESLARSAKGAEALPEPAPEADVPVPASHPEEAPALHAEAERETVEPRVGETGSAADKAPPERKPELPVRAEAPPSDTPVPKQGAKVSAGTKAALADAPASGQKPEASARAKTALADARASGQKPKASVRAEVLPSDAPGPGKRAGFTSAPRSLPAPAPPVVSGGAGKGEKVVLMVGDSMMGWGLGHVLERALNRRPGIRAVRDTRPSTGLASANPFNWPGHLTELVTRHSPDLVVICIGANDGCNIVDQAKKRHVVGTPSWDDAYRQRAGNLLRIAQSGGAKVIWLGLPIVGAEQFARILRRVSLLQQAACADNGQALFIDNYLTLADSEGKYATFLTNKGNKPVRVRAKDKIHITTEGGGILTEFVMPAILKALAPLPPLAAAK
ncbi:MAG: DUF459 domain-containing protein [Desulfovibrio sp.]|jgi:hypothetical protein|nr:DUF459 domain-containing protein [Desulfovibrio sp.]